MFVSGNKKARKAPKPSGGTDKSVSEPIDVFVDSIIGLLEQSTAYLRSVANQAFSLLSSAVQETTIDLILTVRLHVFHFCSCLTTIPFSNWNIAIPRSLRTMTIWMTWKTKRAKRVRMKGMQRQLRTKIKHRRISTILMTITMKMSKNSGERLKRHSKSMV